VQAEVADHPGELARLLVGDERDADAAGSRACRTADTVDVVV
jgi:hypothetical protein